MVECRYSCSTENKLFFGFGSMYLHSFPQSLTLDIRGNDFTARVLRHWHRLPRVLVKLPSLQAFKKCVDMAPGDMG